MGQFLSARSEFHDIPFLEELFFFCKFAGCKDPEGVIFQMGMVLA